MAQTLSTPHHVGTAGRAMIAVAKRLNPFLTPIVSRGFIGVLGTIEHRGRSSGRVYITPIAIRSHGRDFVIPLPYGEGTDWCRNVLTARGAIVRFHAADHATRDPEIVGLDVADRAYPAVLRLMLRVLGIRRFLYLHGI